MRRRVVHYLNFQKPERRSLHDVLTKISARLPDTVIFGGMLREFALGNARTFTSDVDLVSCASAYEIGAAVSSYGPVKNKFGGYRFTVGHWRFDIWALQDTWAFRHGYAGPPSFDSLLDTSFFNLDSAHFHLTSGRVSVHRDYEGWVNDQLLDINLEPNPHPAGMVKRALDLVVHNELSVGKHLQKFLARHAQETEPTHHPPARARGRHTHDAARPGPQVRASEHSRRQGG